MADNLMVRVTAWALDYIDAHGRVDWDDELKPLIYEQFGIELEQHGADLAFELIRRRIKTRLKKNAENALIQTQLDGFEIPQGFTVPTEGGGTTFVSTIGASRAEAEAHLLICEENIRSAIRGRDDWQRMLDYLRPAWSFDSNFTIGECIDWLAAQP